MLYPSMNDLLKKVNNRYLLVNIAAKRARDIAIEAEREGVSLTEKTVKIALTEIMEGRIVADSDAPKEEKNTLFASFDPDGDSFFGDISDFKFPG